VCNVCIQSEIFVEFDGVKIFRKAALQIVEKTKDIVAVTPDDLHRYVGNPVFLSDRMYESTPAGVVMGLAWTAMGGSTLYVESALKYPIDSANSEPSIETTGQLGGVMQESAKIAYTYAKSFLSLHQPDNNFFNKAAVHIHVPAVSLVLSHQYVSLIMPIMSNILLQ
jgi:Lon-like ATP-dependent protease